MRHEGWNQARPVAEYYKKTGRPYNSGLTVVDREMAAYGDWTLYRDEDGNYWEDYFSIGD